MVVSWFDHLMELDVDLLREQSIRCLFPDISTLGHLEHNTVRLVTSGRVQVKQQFRIFYLVLKQF